MKKKLQKIFATLMTISMLMSLLSVTAFAEGESPAPELPPEGPAVTYENKDQIQESDDTEDGYAD